MYSRREDTVEWASLEVVLSRIGPVRRYTEFSSDEDDEEGRAARTEVFSVLCDDKVWLFWMCVWRSNRFEI